jgi:hypothetical protein
MRLRYVPLSSRPGNGSRTCSEDGFGPQKLFFAQYVDNVEDVREISGTSRFLSGGLGGITSQLSECSLVAMREVIR